MSVCPPTEDDWTSRVALSLVSLGVGLGVTPVLAVIALAFAGGLAGCGCQRVDGLVGFAGIDRRPGWVVRVQISSLVGV